MGRLTGIALCAVLLTGVCLAPVRAHEPGAAHYVGNEGVLVTHGDEGVLFDALFDQSYGNYVVPSAQAYAAIHAGEGPFKSVRALFVSHVHGDHFGAEQVLSYLRAQPAVQVYGPLAVAEALREAGATEDELQRVHTFASGPGDKIAGAREAGLAIEVVAVPHANPRRWGKLQNLVFRVTLDQALTVMHFGDADPVVDNFAPYFDGWAAQGQAAALFSPDWFLRSLGGRAILERIDAHQVIAIHVPAEAQTDPQAYRDALGGDAFITPGEQRVLKHEGAER